MAKRADLIATARKYVGTRYVHQGRYAPTGLDCSGVLLLVGRENGIELEDKPGYYKNPNSADFVSHFTSQFLPVPEREWRLGCIGIFTTDRFPLHAGIFTERHGVPHIIHAYLPVRKVIEMPLERCPMILNRVMDWRGLED